MEHNSTPAQSRLYYIDWLRVLVILSLIPFHAALTFSGQGVTYILSPLAGLDIIPYMLIVSTLGNFFMTLLFFVSGIAAYHSIKSKGLRRFAENRRDKLLIPFGLGTLFLCPIQAYFKALYEGFKGNYFEFLRIFFSPSITYYMGYAHLWFLLYLFAFSMVCVPLFSRWNNKPERLEAISSFFCKGYRILLPMAFILLTEMTLRLHSGGQYIIVGDWANDVVYLSSFILGYVFASSLNIQARMDRFFVPAIVITPICISALSYTFWYSAINQAHSRYLGYLWVISKGIYECAAIVLLLGLGKRFLNKKSAVLSYLSEASFTYYLFHFVPVSMFTYIWIRKQINPNIKFILTVVLSYLFVATVYELIVRRIRLHIKH